MIWARITIQLKPTLITKDIIMPKNYSNQNFQKVSFKEKDLQSAIFVDSDVRGTDFTGANLKGADFTNVKTGITPLNTILIFIAALIISLISGYIAMLAGHTIQGMMDSNDAKIRYAGIATTVIIILLIIYYYWKGGRSAIRHIILPVIAIAIIIGPIAYFSGLGTGRGMLYQVLALLLVVGMFVVGTVARASAGSLSNILFLIIAVSGSMFGKTVGGGIGTVIMALACAQISKRALSGAKGFEALRNVAFFITRRFGTSFRDAKLMQANFSHSKIRNADFSNADITDVNWGLSRKINCLVNEKITTEKKSLHKKELSDRT